MAVCDEQARYLTGDANTQREPEGALLSCPLFVGRSDRKRKVGGIDMVRAFVLAFLTLVPSIVLAQSGDVGNNGFGTAGVAPELPPAVLLMGASAVGYAVSRFAKRRR